MTLDALQAAAAEFLETCPENRVAPEDALTPELAGLKIYDAPLFAVGAADDPLFRTLRQPGVVGEGSLLPGDWLPEAACVLSFFLPFTEPVRRSNRQADGGPSDAWLHARIEGQLMMNRFGSFVCEQLTQAGFAAVYPAADSRFQMLHPFASNWSERHVGYICGLGTFGLSRGLITEKGMAGRLGSVVTAAPLPVTPRPYDDPFAYCTMCGKCQKNCPAGAIDAAKGVEHGKDHTLCSPFLDSTRRPPHGPKGRVRFACGKCQVAVPCESRIPKRSTPKEYA